MPIKPATVAEQLAWAYRDFAEEPSLLCNGRFWTFADVEIAASGASSLLAEHGARFGDRIILFLENRAVLRIFELGILGAGMVRVALSPRLHAREVAAIAEDCEAAVVCCSSELQVALQAALDEIGSRTKLIVVSDDDESYVTPAALLARPPADFQEWPAPTPTDTAMLMYSSGTTGTPKGAIVTHGAWVAHTELALAQLPGIGVGDVVLAVAPMAHFGGSIALSCASAGAATVTLDSFDAVSALECVVDFGVTVLPVAPVMLKFLIEDAPPELQERASTTLRAIPYGGSPAATSTLVAASARFRQCLVQYYGLSETLAPIASLGAADHDWAADILRSGSDDSGRARRILESAGRPADGVELRFAETDEPAASSNQRGEIVVRSPMVTTGYWNRPQLTAAALDPDGWFSTGDVGELDADGYLHVLARSKDVIISGGYNVYPGEVEHAISSLAWVEECVVIGVPHRRWGEGVHALVVLREGNHYADDPTTSISELTKDVLEACRRNLAGFKMPRSLEIIAEIPRTLAAKVDRKRALAEYLDRHAQQSG